jgi:alanyl-tRNA synthetase
LSGEIGRLYNEDAYKIRFKARVISVEHAGNRFGVIMDKTLFFPEGGGQPSDTGTINGIPVREVEEKGDAVIHWLDSPLEPGEEIGGEIDWERRFDHMQQHTGQHILSQAFIKCAGSATVGFHLGEKTSTIDLELSVLGEALRVEVEQWANRVVFENRPVCIREAEQGEEEGVRMRNVPGDRGPLRVVEIEGVDRSACCGTHVRRTGEVGMIKIVRGERYKQGVRVTFVCGYRALEDYSKKSRVLQGLVKEMSAGEEELEDAVTRCLHDRKELSRKLRQKGQQLAEMEGEELLRQSEDTGEIRLITAHYRDRPVEEVQHLIRIVCGKKNVVVLVALEAQHAFLYLARSAEPDMDLRPIMEKLTEGRDARGGGTPDRTQSKWARPEELREALDQGRDLLLNQLRTKSG